MAREKSLSKHKDQTLSLIVDKRERLMDFPFSHGPEGSDISAQCHHHRFRLSTTKTLILTSRPPGYRGPRGPMLPTASRPLLRSLTCFPTPRLLKGPPDPSFFPKVPVGWGGWSGGEAQTVGDTVGGGGGWVFTSIPTDSEGTLLGWGSFMWRSLVSCCGPR